MAEALPELESREQFLTLLLEQLTEKAPLRSDEATATAMLQRMASILRVTGSYVIMLEGDEEVSVQSRYAWYDTDVAPITFERFSRTDMEALYRGGPLVIDDAEALPPHLEDFAKELTSRGLNAALMQGVFVDDRLRGFVGFNDAAARAWTDEERNLAAQLADSLVWTLDKQAAEQRLVQAEERIRSFIEATPIPVYCWEFDPPIPTDLTTDEQLAALDRGILVECNEAFARAFALGSIDDALGATYARVSQLNPPAFEAQLRHFIDNGYRSVDHSTEATTERGRRRHYRSNAAGFVRDGRLFRIWGSTRDITELTEAERTVAEQRERLNLALEAAGVGFFEWDLETRSGAMELPESLGVSETRIEFGGRDDVRRFLDERSVETMLAGWDRYRSGADERFSTEFSLEHDGETHHLLAQGKRVAPPSGDGPGAVLAVVQDITQIRRAELEAEALAEQMRIAQKLESLGLLAGGIAHDFNNLLLAIMGSADLVEPAVADDVDARRHLKEVVDASRIASDLCRQLLAYAGKGSFVLESVDPQQLIANMRGLLESSIDRRIELRFEFGESEPVLVDASQLQQVLLNLVINAGEAIGSAPGEIVVSTGTRNCTTDELVEPYTDQQLEAGRYTYVAVSDTGSGMAPEVQERLFDPFFTTKFTGRGLGMAAVLGIVRGHKGSIKVTTGEGTGTEVRVFLPADGDTTAARTPTPSRAAEPATATGSGAVLFIDDDDMVRTVGAAMLERLGYEPLVADTGAEALRLHEQHRDRIVCVVLDLTMPEMDGIETFTRLRAADDSLKVILASGYNEQEATREFVGRGLAAFIQKPFVAADLQAVIDRVLAVDPSE